MPITIRAPRCSGQASTLHPLAEREACIEQLLRAVADIAEFDDIHQAALRLAEVQDWISREAARAAADPMFGAPRLAS